MAQTFGCPPHVLATATAADGAFDRAIFTIGNDIEGSIVAAKKNGTSPEAVMRLLIREAEAELG